MPRLCFALYLPLKKNHIICWFSSATSQYSFYSDRCAILASCKSGSALSSLRPISGGLQQHSLELKSFLCKGVHLKIEGKNPSTKEDNLFFPQAVRTTWDRTEWRVAFSEIFQNMSLFPLLSQNQSRLIRKTHPTSGFLLNSCTGLLYLL